MRQPHKNLFFFYRGARPSDDRNDLTFERQLEDNTTKALIHVLEHSDRARVLTTFLRQIVNLKIKPDCTGVQFALQRVDIRRPAIPKRNALAIAPIKGLTALKDFSHMAGRPDAWIWSENEFAILLENKISGRANLGQIKRHIASATGWTYGHTKIISSSWSEVYEFFDNLRRYNGRLDPVSGFLIKEFLEYLKMIGVANTSTFEIDDFAFFTIRPADRQLAQKDIVTRKLRQFTEELSRMDVVRKIVRLYGREHLKSKSYVNPGTFRNDSNNYWITLGPKERRDHCHFTVRITEEGIRLDTFAPHRHFTRKLIKSIQADPKHFLDTLKRIPHKESFLIRLREAYYSNPQSSYKGQRIGDFTDYLEVHPSFINKHNINTLIIEPILERLDRKDLRPEIFLVRDFHLSELLSKTDTVKLVAEAAEKMVPYLRFALSVTRPS